MTTLDRLQQWYTKNCDGSWEHQNGVTIETLDNPGWGVSIDLIGTELEFAEFKFDNLERSDEDWIQCKVVEKTFSAAGGPANLEEILETFLEWSKEA